MRALLSLGGRVVNLRNMDFDQLGDKSDQWEAGEEDGVQVSFKQQDDVQVFF